jgi:hypothetical protein
VSNVEKRPNLIRAGAFVGLAIGFSFGAGLLIWIDFASGGHIGPVELLLQVLMCLIYAMIGGCLGTGVGFVLSLFFGRRKIAEPSSGVKPPD